VLWTCDAGDAIESSAAIAGDLVFVGAAAGELVALNFSDGKKRWTYILGLGRPLRRVYDPRQSPSSVFR